MRAVATSEAAARAEITALLDAFVAAFSTFDGRRVGALFATPGVALRSDGSLRGFSTEDEVAGYYQSALDRYRGEGCRGCRFWDLELSFLNETTATATVSWDLLAADGSILSSWRQAYFVTVIDGAWRIYGSAFVWDLRRETRP